MTNEQVMAKSSKKKVSKEMKTAFIWTSMITGVLSMVAGSNPFAPLLRYWISKAWLKEHGTKKDGIKLGIIAFLIHIAISFVIFTIIAIIWPEVFELIT